MGYQSLDRDYLIQREESYSCSHLTQGLPNFKHVIKLHKGLNKRKSTGCKLRIWDES